MRSGWPASNELNQWMGHRDQLEGGDGMRLVRCPFISSFIATSSGTERVSAPNLQKALGRGQFR